MVNPSRRTTLLIVSLIIGGVIGFFLGKSVVQKPPTSSTAPTQANSLFRSQTATFQGEISKVNSDSLDVKSDSGQTGSLTLSNKVVIYKFKEGSKQATASSDLSSIETGKKVLIILEFSGGQYKQSLNSSLRSEYKVVSISYQPAPAPAPTATPLKKK